MDSAVHRFAATGIPVILPDDLSLWVGKHTLLRWTTEIVDGMRVQTSGSQSIARPEAVRSMLRLLTYCYSAGTFATPEIEAGLYRDDMIRSLCAEIYPDPDDVAYFRSAYGDALRASLVLLLKRLWPLRRAAASAAAAGATGSAVMEVPAERLDQALAADAARRMALAAQLDA